MMRTTTDTDLFRAQWLELLQPMVHAHPTADRPEAQEFVRDLLASKLALLGFNVELYGEGSAPVMVARRDGQGTDTLGMAAHYDVEKAGSGWTTPPDELVQVGGRLWGRGLADNLGPLCMRLVALEFRTEPTPPLVWVIQGEEEIGSPLAHQVYPQLHLPDVCIWLEETGYFEANGEQRLLVARSNPDTDVLIDAVARVAQAEGRGVRIHERHLNKAFGEQRCPFLTHLAADAPYLAIGPCDPGANIHRADESLPLSTLGTSVRQFDALLDAMVMP